MKKPKNKGKKQGPQPPEIIRHYETLSPKETDEVVDGVVDLIVNFLKKGGPDSSKAKVATSGESGSEKPDSGSGKKGGGGKRITVARVRFRPARLF
ncbi:MAG: hypothetical protein ACE5JH_11580 [Acidobacteriota bacterium]